MRLYNTTRKTTITDEIKIVEGLYNKSLGLLSKKNPRSLILHTRFGIHTFGLKLPIDVLILDKKNKVVALKENLSINSFFFWNPRYNIIVELPLGSIRKSKTQKNDILKLKKSP